MIHSHYTDAGLIIARPDNVADLLSLPDPPQRVSWEKAGIELCLVPAGDFVMGRPEHEGYDSEHPEHVIYLDPYYIARYPVTNEQYARFVQETGHRVPYDPLEQSCNWNPDSQTPPRGKEKHPVVNVSWEDATTYCEWASLRLPSEAEWEKAARGPDGRSYPWGHEDPTATLCNFDRNLEGTTPVGHYSPHGDSPYGCADLVGNVWEWVNDWYQDDYYRRSPSENPTGPSSGEYRVLRGGSWVSFPHNAHGASRDGASPANTCDFLGFRCARGSQ